MSAFNVTNYLKDIDAEIITHRQEIAKHQLRIAQLQDMRVLMMSREEDRAAFQGQPSPFGTLPDGAVIAVRDPLTYQPSVAALAIPPAAKIGRPPMSEEERRERQRLREHKPERRNYKREYERRKRVAERAEVLAKYGTDDSSLKANGHNGNGHSIDQRLDAVRKVGRPGTARHRQYTDRVRRIFLERPSTPIMTREVMDIVFSDRVPAKADKQCVYQCLYDLKKAGELHQSHQGEPYTLVQR